MQYEYPGIVVIGGTSQACWGSVGRTRSIEGSTWGHGGFFLCRVNVHLCGGVHLREGGPPCPCWVPEVELSFRSCTHAGSRALETKF